MQCALSAAACQLQRYHCKTRERTSCVLLGLWLTFALKGVSSIGP
jgi:hypothetical protein